MNKFIGIILLIFALNVNLFSQQSYVSDKFGFRIDFPDGWKIKSSDSETIVASASGGENIEINVGLQGTGALGDSALLKMGLEKFVSTMEEQFKTHYQGFTTLEHGQSKLDSVDAFYMTYTISDEKTDKMRGIQYFVVRNNRLYVITAGAPDSYYSAYEEKFKNSISSFKFTSK